MAIRLVLDVKVLVLLVHAVRRALLPLRDAGCRLAAGLVFVHFEGWRGGEGSWARNEVGGEELGEGKRKAACAEDGWGAACEGGGEGHEVYVL